MPSSTFFRLPQEKKDRLLDAAWEEFTRTRFSTASINKIILKARIPRGSFYQYFADKEDLFQYLLEGNQEHFVSLLGGLLEEKEGDLFAVPMAVFDRFSPVGGQSDLHLNRFVQLFRINHGLDLHQFLSGGQGFMPDAIWERVDTSLLRSRERGFAEKVFCLLLTCTAPAVLITLSRPEEWESQRRLLEERLDILRLGAATPQPAATAVY